MPRNNIPEQEEFKLEDIVNDNQHHTEINQHQGSSIHH